MRAGAGDAQKRRGPARSRGAGGAQNSPPAQLPAVPRLALRSFPRVSRRPSLSEGRPSPRHRRGAGQGLGPPSQLCPCLPACLPAGARGGGSDAGRPPPGRGCLPSGPGSSAAPLLRSEKPRRRPLRRRLRSLPRSNRGCGCGGAEALVVVAAAAAAARTTAGPAARARGPPLPPPPPPPAAALPGGEGRGEGPHAAARSCLPSLSAARLLRAQAARSRTKARAARFPLPGLRSRLGPPAGERAQAPRSARRRHGRQQQQEAAAGLPLKAPRESGEAPRGSSLPLAAAARNRPTRRHLSGQAGPGRGREREREAASPERSAT